LCNFPLLCADNFAGSCNSEGALGKITAQVEHSIESPYGEFEEEYGIYYFYL